MTCRCDTDHGLCMCVPEWWDIEERFYPNLFVTVIGRQVGKSMAKFAQHVWDVFSSMVTTVTDVFEEMSETLAPMAKPLRPPRHGPPAPHPLQAGCRGAAGTFPTLAPEMGALRAPPLKVILPTLHKPP